MKGLLLAIAVGGAGIAFVVAAADAQDVTAFASVPPSTVPRLWVFFAPEQGDLTTEFDKLRAVLRSHPRIALRPVLLARDAAAIEKPPAAFAASLRPLFQIAQASPGLGIVDPEGLATAKVFDITLLPAYALEEPPQSNGRRRVRVAQGRGADLEVLLR